jgi:hypothetical protein
LQWLSTEPYIGHHKQAKKDVLKGTGQWLLSDPVFIRWKDESASSILWLHGIPGSGKTKLLYVAAPCVLSAINTKAKITRSIVVENLISEYKHCRNLPPAYFYCSRNPTEPGRGHPDKILASIARQLSSLEPGLPLLPSAVTAYQENMNQGLAAGPPGLPESRDLIVQLINSYPSVTIAIDAIDECNPDSRQDLLEALTFILQNTRSLVKVFVSSRDDQDIVRTLEDCPNLEIRSGRNSKDIDEFVKAETQAMIDKKQLLERSKKKEELQVKIIKKITEGAHGM